jgi:hypothetical protein
MPTTRILYTLNEVKALLAEKEGVPVENVDVHDIFDIYLEPRDGDSIKVKKNTYLFQVDK